MEKKQLQVGDEVIISSTDMWNNKQAVIVRVDDINLWYRLDVGWGTDLWFCEDCIRKITKLERAMR